MPRRRYELKDMGWSIIQPLLPNKLRGVSWPDDRRVLNGILWRFRTGSPWAEIPKRYGPLTTRYNRFVRWRNARVWTRLQDLNSLIQGLPKAGQHVIEYQRNYRDENDRRPNVTEPLLQIFKTISHKNTNK